MTDAEIHQAALQLTNMIGQWMAHLHVIAKLNPTRAFQIAALVREELDKLERGN